MWSSQIKRDSTYGRATSDCLTINNLSAKNHLYKITDTLLPAFKILFLTATGTMSLFRVKHDRVSLPIKLAF